MPDMLVRLYQLPDARQSLERVKEHGVTIRRPQAYEMRIVRDFIEQHFTTTWADEVMTAFTHQPVTAYIAILDERIVGFGAYECTRRGYFGPTGVMEIHRGKGIGMALLILCLQGMAEMGYAYAIIGGAGPVDFYAKAVGAQIIEDSVPGIYTKPVKLPETPSENAAPS